MTEACRHESFVVQADVTRVLNDREEIAGGEVVMFACDLRVRCENCGEAFGWRGVPCGTSVAGQPMRSADALELRAWLLSPADLGLAGVPAGLLAP